MADYKCRTTDPKEDIGYLIWQITKFWQRGKHRALDEFGLTSSQLEILGAVFHLTKEGKEITQILLSQETHIDPMTTSTILRNLQKKGLIMRKESETDTRARIVELTRDGNDLFEKAVSKIRMIYENIFENIDIESLKKHLNILLSELNRVNNQDKQLI